MCLYHLSLAVWKFMAHIFLSELIANMLKLLCYIVVFYLFLILFSFPKIWYLRVCFLLGPPRNWKNTDYPWASQCHFACNSSKSALQVRTLKVLLRCQSLVWWNTLSFSLAGCRCGNVTGKTRFDSHWHLISFVHFHLFSFLLM